MFAFDTIEKVKDMINIQYPGFIEVNKCDVKCPFIFITNKPHSRAENKVSQYYSLQEN
jgi:hypothetical protein